MKFSLVDLTRDFVENNTHNKGLNEACLLEDDATFDTICTADTKGNLRIWSTENPNRLQMLYDLENAHGGCVNGLSSSDNTLFSCSRYEFISTY
jgi:WD40 repeat protein